MKKKIFFAAGLAIAACFIFTALKGRDLTHRSYQLDLIVFSVLKDSNVPAQALVREKYAKRSLGKIYPTRFLHITKEYAAPVYFSQWSFQNKLDAAARAYGFALAQSDFVYGKSDKLLTFALTYKRVPVYTLLLRQKIVARTKARAQAVPEEFAVKRKPKVAIVLDDWGYSKNNLGVLWQVRMPLTLAILPNLSYSQDIAAQASKKGYEVILHMPMEAKDQSISQEEKVIKTTMNDAEVLGVLRNCLKSVPHAKGISNHMGSLATESKRLMSVVLGEIKKEGLYFLDSMSTPDSVCEPLAKELGVRCASRDVFLDNIDEPSEIRQRLYEVAAEAMKNGHAIGIGHDRPKTLEVIKDTMPELQKSGITFVHLSDLMRK